LGQMAIFPDPILRDLIGTDSSEIIVVPDLIYRVLIEQTHLK